MGGTDIWTIVAVVFVAEYVLPKVGVGLRWAFTWARDLHDLRQDLYEEVDEDEEAD